MIKIDLLHNLGYTQGDCVIKLLTGKPVEKTGSALRAGKIAAEAAAG